MFCVTSRAMEREWRLASSFMKIPKLPAIVWMACVIAFVASVLFLAPGLPDRVATHFGFSGRANGWMPRSTYTLFFIVFGIFFIACFRH